MRDLVVATMETTGVPTVPPGSAAAGFSVVIPVKEINAYLRESIPFILALDHPAFEVIVLPNDMPAEGVPSFMQDPRIRVISTGRVSPALKRDEGARQARYDHLAFLDDDAYPRADWLTNAAAAFQSSRAAAVGGPGVMPADARFRERVSGLFFETLVGGGGLDYRYRPAGRGFFVDDYPTVNFLVRGDAFRAVGGFDNDYWPGEDTKFCRDLVATGRTIWYDPDVVVHHHRRPTLVGHLRQLAGYGRHRGRFARLFPETSARLVYFAPALFVLGSTALLGGGLLEPMLWRAYAALMLVYFMIVMVDVFRRTANPALGLATVGLVFCSHVTYGLNFLAGFLSGRSFRSKLR